MFVDYEHVETQVTAYRAVRAFARKILGRRA